MKKINITTALLCIYILVMGVLFHPDKNPQIDFKSYFIVLGGTVFITIILRIVQIRRLKIRDKWRKENEDKINKQESAKGE